VPRASNIRFVERNCVKIYHFWLPDEIYDCIGGLEEDVQGFGEIVGGIVVSDEEGDEKAKLCPLAMRLLSDCVQSKGDEWPSFDEIIEDLLTAGFELVADVNCDEVKRTHAFPDISNTYRLTIVNRPIRIFPSKHNIAAFIRDLILPVVSILISDFDKTRYTETTVSSKIPSWLVVGIQDSHASSTLSRVFKW
jgi:hypothetical protein